MPYDETQLDELTAPVETLDQDRGRGLDEGIALCLSGGGYRAMVFHVGSLWRLNELGYLPRLSRVSSVSGGSITAAMLGMNWTGLTFDGSGATTAYGVSGVATNFVERVVDPIRELAGHTIDQKSILRGLFGRGSISDRVTKEYAKRLYGKATLQDLPSDEQGPRFVINATNVQSGALWRFSKPYMADYRVGRVDEPTTSLAQAVAGSSAFPPFLSPAKLKLNPGDVKDQRGTSLHRRPYTEEVVLSDGGVYDNLGLETAFKRYRTLLVSDGGGQMEPEPDPATDWARHSIRVASVIDNQVRSLRKRSLIGSFVTGSRNGTFWGIRTDIADYGLSDALSCPHQATMDLAKVPTRLAAMDSRTQERLINWGYAVCDAALRRHVHNPGNQPPRFPYAGGVG